MERDYKEEKNIIRTPIPKAKGCIVVIIMMIIINHLLASP